MNVTYLNENVLKLIKPRKQDGNKGDFGSLTTLCGSVNMTGAAALSTLGALRSGLGLLRFAGNEETVKRMQQIIFEPVFIPLEKIWEYPCDAFLCGCGIGRDYDRFLPQVLDNCKVTAVLDADCINFLAKNIDILERAKYKKILTPHPGEMARLCSTTVENIQADRIGHAKAFAKKYECTLVLKGYQTVIAHPDGSVFVNTSGSDALSTGGSGDVHAGVIASLTAQGYSEKEATAIGVYVHGLAAERLSEKYGKSGVIPSDLPCVIGSILG